MAWVHWYKGGEVQSRLYHQVLALQSLRLHMIKMIEHCCVEVKTCVKNTKPEIVL